MNASQTRATQQRKPLPVFFSEVYDCNASYEQNYQQGPQFCANYPDKKYDQSLKYNFLGFELLNPIGISAGPLLNADWVRFYASFGFGALVYKTVRSVFQACHPWPNCVYVNAPELSYHKGRMPSLTTTEGVQGLEKLSITNSFGVPSMAPEIWMADFEQAQKSIHSSQLLLLSILGSEGAGGRGLAADFAYTAAMAKEAGAKMIEVNLSCPNLVGRHHATLYEDAENVAKIAAAIRQAAGDLPVLLKVGALEPQDLEALVSATRCYVQGYVGINTLPVQVRKADGFQALPGEGRLSSGIGGVAIRRAASKFTQDLAQLRHKRSDDFAIVGVGGIMNACDLDQRLKDGADLAMSATATMWDPYLALRWSEEQE